MILETALFNQIKNSNAGAAGLGFALIFYIILFVIIIGAIYQAYKCNHGFWPILGAVFFPILYWIVYFVKKYVMKIPGYCENNLR